MLNKPKARWKNEAGPRKAKTVLALLTELDRESTRFTQLSGVEGGEEHRATLSAPIGPAKNPRALELMREIGDAYDWTITSGNMEELRRALPKAIKEAEESRPVEDRRISPEKAEQNRRRSEDAEKAERERRERVKTSAAKILAKKPRGAKALIVAELDQDKSDAMTDYFNHHTTRHVAIGWRMTQRESFPALRKAAATFPPTEHLGPGKDIYTPRVVVDSAPSGSHYFEGSFSHWHRELDDSGRHKFSTEAEAEAFIQEQGDPEPVTVDGEDLSFRWKIKKESVEHRDNYSMGSGNYLKDGHTHSNGWRVRSYSLGWVGGDSWTYELEDGLSDEPDAQASEKPEPVTGAEWSINNEKGGVEIRFPSRPPRSVLDALKSNGWRWSRFSQCWYTRDTDKARSFARELVEGETAAA